MQWGWDSIRAEGRAERFADYWVLTIAIGRRGICWHFYPKAAR